MKKLALSRQPGYNRTMVGQLDTTTKQLCHLLSGLWQPVKPESGLSWSDMVQLARDQSVASLLHGAIHNAGLTLPQDAAKALEYTLFQSVTVDTFRTQDMERLPSTLAKAGSPFILLKGAALDRTLYHGLALRNPGDIDLLIQRDSLPSCRQALESLGYHSVDVDVTTGSRQSYQNEEGFAFREPGHAHIDVHWHLLDVPYYVRNVPLDWFWQNTQSIEISGQPVQVLNPEANMLYLPAHLAFHHRYHTLQGFVDLAVLLDRYRKDLDWAKIIDAAREFELLLVLRETLDRLADLWPSLALVEIRRRLHELQPTPFEQKLFHLLTTEPRSPYLDFYTDIICLPKAADRLHFVWHNAFPQPAYMLRRYGVARSWELPFWYLYRLGDGFSKAARTLPQVLRSR